MPSRDRLEPSRIASLKVTEGTGETRRRAAMRSPFKSASGALIKPAEAGMEAARRRSAAYTRAAQQ
jgi:hypothetical protein